MSQIVPEVSQNGPSVSVEPKKVGPFEFYADQGSIRCNNGESVHLCGQEKLFLKLLVEADGAIVSKADLYRVLHEEQGSLAEQKIIDITICKVRRKLDALIEKGGDYIVTAWGKGYRLSQEPVARLKLYRSKRGPHTGVKKNLENLRTSWKEAT